MYACVSFLSIPSGLSLPFYMETIQEELVEILMVNYFFSEIIRSLENIRAKIKARTLHCTFVLPAESKNVKKILIGVKWIKILVHYTGGV